MSVIAKYGSSEMIGGIAPDRLLAEVNSVVVPTVTSVSRDDHERPAGEEVWVIFDEAPTAPEVAATLAAIQAHAPTPPPPTTVEIAVADQWVEVWSEGVLDGNAVLVDANLEATQGEGAAAVSASLVHRGVCSRPSGEALGGVGNSTAVSASAIPGLELRTVATGNAIALQLRATNTGTVRCVWSLFECSCRQL